MEQANRDTLPFSLDGSDGSWIPVFRRIRDHWTWQDKPFNKGAAWVDLLIRANYHDSEMPFRAAVLPVKPREVACTYKGLAEDWGWSRDRVVAFLSALEREGAIRRDFRTWDRGSREWCHRKTDSGICVLTVVRMPVKGEEKTAGISAGVQQGFGRSSAHPKKVRSKEGQKQGATPPPPPPLEGTDTAPTVGGWAVPEPIRGLKLYEQDPKLCVRFPELLAEWQQSYPGVNHLTEIRAAHAWELSNPHRPRKHRAAFLNNWLKKSADRKQAVVAQPERIKDNEPPPL